MLREVGKVESSWMQVPPEVLVFPRRLQRGSMKTGGPLKNLSFSISRCIFQIYLRAE
jgi:hypothetical protein